jgi:Ran GTPase-activating protein (RanGAP) involved in mRNA processing and transport
LDNNDMDATAVELLVLALQFNKTLQSLCLCRNDLGVVGARFVATMLPHNSALRTLGLTECLIDTVGGESLLDAMRRNTGLYTLRLEQNSIDPTVRRALTALTEHNRERDRLAALGYTLPPLPDVCLRAAPSESPASAETRIHPLDADAPASESKRRKL